MSQSKNKQNKGGKNFKDKLDKTIEKTKERKDSKENKKEEKPDEIDILETLKYYFSEKNLKRDEFFKSEIELHQGKVSLETILNCPKIQKSAKTFEEIIEILNSETNTFFKLISESPKTPTNTFITSDVITDAFNNQKALSDKDLLFIVSIVTKSANKIFFNDLEYCLNEEFKNKFKCVYSRLKHKEEKIDSHVVLRPQEGVTEDSKVIAKEQLIKENKILLSIPTKEEEEDFQKEHGDHMKQVIEKTVETKRKRELFFKLLDHKFNSTGSIKSFFKRIILRQKNWNKVGESDAEQLKELVKHHPNQAKFTDSESYTVGPHPEHSDNKCFYVVKKDGSKEDFSIVKCVSKIEEKFFNKPKDKTKPLKK